MDKNQYKIYLESDEWKSLSKLARERADFKCEFCGGKPDNVHHCQYPKNISYDELDNLIMCCNRCHKLCHGIRENNKISDEYDDNYDDGLEICYCCSEYFPRSELIIEEHELITGNVYKTICKNCIKLGNDAMDSIKQCNVCKEYFDESDIDEGVCRTCELLN